MNTHSCANLRLSSPAHISVSCCLGGWCLHKRDSARAACQGGTISIFRGFRDLVEAIQALCDTLNGIARQQEELGPALERLNTLERTRHQFEAECEGMLLKADGKLKAANSAEQRERQLKKANERLSFEFDPAGEEGTERETVLADDVAGGEAPRVPAVRLVLATNDKTHAVRTKWGIA